jgi:mRNA interferase MazF
MISQRDIILLEFPFSNLKQTKIRPVIVLSNSKYNSRSEDIVVVPLTTNLTRDEHDVLITNEQLEKGHLITDSKVKIDRIFSVHRKLVTLKIGKISKQTHSSIIKILFDLVK